MRSSLSASIAVHQRLREFLKKYFEKLRHRDAQFLFHRFALILHFRAPRKLNLHLPLPLQSSWLNSNLKKLNVLIMLFVSSCTAFLCSFPNALPDSLSKFRAVLSLIGKFCRNSWRALSHYLLHICRYVQIYHH